MGPGQHDHTIERMIRHLKEVIRATKHSLPFLVPDFMMTIMVVLCVVCLFVLNACDETAVMAGINALSNDEDKSSTIPKQTDVM